MVKHYQSRPPDAALMIGLLLGAVALGVLVALPFGHSIDLAP